MQRLKEGKLEGIRVKTGRRTARKIQVNPADGGGNAEKLETVLVFINSRKPGQAALVPGILERYNVTKSPAKPCSYSFVFRYFQVSGYVLQPIT